MEMEQVKEWIVSGPGEHPISINHARSNSAVSTDRAESPKSRPSLGRLSSSSIIKRIVSKNRRRFVNDDFDLDLSYISDSIISTSYPAVGGATLFRNSIRDLSRFLMTYHYDRYKVYNLCSELEYDTSILDERVVRYPCDDMQPPPLEVIYRFCEDALEWIQLDPENVIVVHCQAGKGRTGVMVSSLLLFMETCETTKESVDMFAQLRTNDGKGVTIPSQIRYINYFNTLLKNPIPYNQHGLKFVKIRLINMNQIVKKNGLAGIVLAISQRNSSTEMQTQPISTVKLPNYKTLSSGAVIKEEGGYSFQLDGDDIMVLFDETEYPLSCKGDVKVQMFKGIPCKRNSMFYLWFHAGIEGVTKQTINYHYKELDKACGSVIKHEIGLDISTAPACEIDILNSPRYSESFEKWDSEHFQTVEESCSSQNDEDIPASRNTSLELSANSLTRLHSFISLKSLSEEAMSNNPQFFGSANLPNSQLYARNADTVRDECVQISKLKRTLSTTYQLHEIMKNFDKAWFSQAF